MAILFVSVPSSESRRLLPRFMTRAGTFRVAGSLYFFLLCAFSSCWLSGFQNGTAERSLVFLGSFWGDIWRVVADSLIRNSCHGMRAKRPIRPVI